MVKSTVDGRCQRVWNDLAAAAAVTAPLHVLRLWTSAARRVGIVN